MSAHLILLNLIILITNQGHKEAKELFRGDYRVKTGLTAVDGNRADGCFGDVALGDYVHPL
jgi:hypothetical protein